MATSWEERASALLTLRASLGNEVFDAQKKKLLEELRELKQTELEAIVWKLVELDFLSVDEATRLSAPHSTGDEHGTLYLCGGQAVDALLLPVDDAVHVYFSGEYTETQVQENARVLIYMDISSSMNHDEAGKYQAPGSDDHPASSIAKARALLPDMICASLVRQVSVSLVVWNHEVQTTIDFTPEEFTTEEGFVEDLNEKISAAVSVSAFKADGATDTEFALKHLSHKLIELSTENTSEVTVWFLTDGEQTYYHKGRKIVPVENTPFFQDVNETGLSEYQRNVMGDVEAARMSVVELRCAVEFHVCHFGDADPLFLRCLRETWNGHFHAFTDIDALASEMQAAASGSNDVVIFHHAEGETRIPAMLSEQVIQGRGVLPPDALAAFLAGRAPISVVFKDKPDDPVVLSLTTARICSKKVMEAVRATLSIEPALRVAMDSLTDMLTPEGVARAAGVAKDLRMKRGSAVAMYADAIRDGTMLQTFLQKILESTGSHIEGLLRIIGQFMRGSADDFNKTSAVSDELFTSKDVLAICASVESMRVRLGHGLVTSERTDKQIMRIVAEGGPRAAKMLARVCRIVRSTEGSNTKLTLIILEGAGVQEAHRTLAEQLATELGNNEAALLLNSQASTVDVVEKLSHGDHDTILCAFEITVRDGDRVSSLSCADRSFTGCFPESIVVAKHTVVALTSDVNDACTRFLDPLSCADFIDLIEEGTLPCYLYTLARVQSVGLLFNAKELINVRSGGSEAASHRYFRLYWRLQHGGDSGSATDTVTLPGSFSPANAALPIAPEPLTNLVLSNLMPSLMAEFATGTPLAPLPAVGDFYIGYLFMHMTQKRFSGVDVSRMAEIISTLYTWVANPRTLPRLEAVADVVDELVRTHATPPASSPGRQVPRKAMAYALLPSTFSPAERYYPVQAEIAHRTMKYLLLAKLPGGTVSLKPAKEWCSYIVDCLADCLPNEEVDALGIPTKALQVADELHVLLGMERRSSRILEFLRRDGVVDVVLSALREILYDKGNDSLCRGDDLLRWPLVQRLLLVYGALLECPVQGAIDAFAQFKRPDEFEASVMRHLSPLVYTEGDQPTHVAAGTLASCKTDDGFLLVRKPAEGPAVVRRVVFGEKPSVEEMPLSAEAAEEDLLFAVWDIFAAGLRRWSWDKSSSTCYGLHSTDYDIVRALKDPACAKTLSPKQLSEYNAVMAYNPVWHNYDRFIPPPPEKPDTSGTTRLGRHDVRVTREEGSVPTYRYIVAGHVDAGKSTLCGHMLVCAGTFDRKVIEKFEREAMALGLAGRSYAWIMDKLLDERQRGLSIVAEEWRMETPHLNIAVVDVPGHSKFMSNMLVGACSNDGALVVVSAEHGVFEEGVGKCGSTRTHLLHCLAAGAQHLVVAVNKMDAVQYSEQRFLEIEAEMRHVAAKVGFKGVPAVVPTSGLSGGGIGRPQGEDMSWFKGWSATTAAGTKFNGFTLLEALDAVDPMQRITDGPLRMPVRYVTRVPGIGTVIVGTIASGQVSVGMKVAFSPSGFCSRVRSIETFYSSLDTAGPGESVGVCLAGASPRDISRGDVMHVQGVDDAPPVESFKIRVRLSNIPNQLQRGFECQLHVHTATVHVRLVDIYEVTRKGQRIDGASGIKTNDVAVVKFEPTQALCVEAFSKDTPIMGRAILRNCSTTIGIGPILSVKTKATPQVVKKKW